MGQPAEQISAEQLKSYGYSDDILPKTSRQRDWGVFHYIPFGWALFTTSCRT
ncbi:hypothetical protein [Brevibacillus parabrevis]|uniref:hypothetical protein n=1 Tax=Brevibacillus parabrevis TaxID=54914 RepID=UPI0028D1E1CB|nr:hypothetical protein [Brevibacillus parabrevis]